MKKNTLKRLVILLFICLITSTTLSAQMLMQKVSLKRQVENSSLIVEGKVISKRSFWDADYKRIYTANTVEVYKVFKGNSPSTIDVITPGGAVNGTIHMAFPSLKLNVGDLGTFALHQKQIDNSNNVQYKPYSSSQGFYKYDVYKNVVLNPFTAHQGITNNFYSSIKSFTKNNIIELKSFDLNNVRSKFSKSVVPSGISFPATPVSAGTKTQITITGSGFGSVQGKVGFSNADTGGLVMGVKDYIDALDTEVITWGENSITVEVPSSAGTGTIRITDNLGASAESTQELEVSFSEINIASSFNGGGGEYAYQVRHYNSDSSGGYEWQLHTEFDANTAAKTAFIRALDTWRCETGINFSIAGTTTTTDVVNLSDGIYVVRFDNGNELPDGNLGVCYFSLGICATDSSRATVEAYVAELDMVFNDDVNNPDTPANESWFYWDGDETNFPGFFQYDFQSVALHELGHGHMLGHVIDKNPDGDDLDDVMHYSLQNFEYQRVLRDNNKTAANGIQARSTGSSLCMTDPAMTNYSCSLSVNEEVFSNNGVSVFPNPAKHRLFIRNDALTSLVKAEIFDFSGRLIAVHDLIDMPRTKEISLQGIASGVYFVKISSDTSSVSQKIVFN